MVASVGRTAVVRDAVHGLFEWRGWSRLLGRVGHGVATTDGNQNSRNDRAQSHTAPRFMVDVTSVRVSREK
jgi:hypothetical protein